MPIKRHVVYLRRIAVGHLKIGVLMLWLITLATACVSSDIPSPDAALTVAAQQKKIAAIVAASEVNPTKISTLLPTPSLIPTQDTPVIQLPQEQSSTPDITPTLLVSTLPTHSPSPTTVITTAVAVADILTSVPIEATVKATPIVMSTEIVEIVAFNAYDIGLSSRGFPLKAYQFNDGPQRIVIVGAIHGGYEWNTSLLSYEIIDYFAAHPDAVPETISLIVIPSANPDGQELVTGKVGRFSVLDLVADTTPGRFNGNGVDLNRNWDCQWSPQATWRGRVVSGGEEPFSEPETKILRDFLLQQDPAAVIFLHSAANGVFASGCPDIHPPSMDLARVYGQASGYPVYETFSAYDVTGDAGDWLTLHGIPSISIELKNHENLDLEQNLAGMLAILDQLK